MKYPEFQKRVEPWMTECFGAEISADIVERNHRFIEEALELVQACGATADECHQLVDYVYGRPVGEPKQEVGGVMVTLAALCLAQNLDMHDAAETELERIWTKVDEIRTKQAAKPKNSPLPVQIEPAMTDQKSNDIVGHKTLSDGKGGHFHAPLTRQKAAEIWEQVEKRKAKRSADMPTERDAVAALFEAHERLKELGWRQAIYCPKDGSRFQVIEAGSTGFHTCFYNGDWPSGSWVVVDEYDAYPSRPILFKPLDN